MTKTEERLIKWGLRLNKEKNWYNFVHVQAKMYMREQFSQVNQSPVRVKEHWLDYLTGAT